MTFEQNPGRKSAYSTKMKLRIVLSDETWKIFFRLTYDIGGDPRLLHIAQWIICGCPHSRHGAQYVTIMMDPAKVLSRKPRTKFSRAKVLSISLSALRSRSSRSFSSPFNRAVSFSTHCSADVPLVECNFPEVQIFQGVSYVCCLLFNDTTYRRKKSGARRRIIKKFIFPFDQFFC